MEDVFEMDKTSSYKNLYIRRSHEAKSRRLPCESNLFSGESEQVLHIKAFGDHLQVARCIKWPAFPGFIPI